ncbi:hypothetical protein Dtox_3074 [Desulfofarcimen acetoxidans DSM 771]|uniref:Uncharacterized protein n=1 Tax=Desulfofarcimen acetoxidans (strain ATCC 49208 / DSM 771 / KCTC 5769 / VKM B-1644 / 5575) TaxID=485916 RepID=C8W3P0_DESAS|nr:hypothetical protein [Desulfofarcimen acetoxidans]ACV63826.1 hypothetical protein Dtox_3074 [Desulfofarcimen acetoxidans DSM 771]
MGFDCCDTRGPKTRTIMVNGKQIGIQDLDRILFEVENSGVHSDEQIKIELLKKVKEKNYVSPAMQQNYALALFEEYERLRRNIGYGGRAACDLSIK